MSQDQPDVKMQALYENLMFFSPAYLKRKDDPESSLHLSSALKGIVTSDSKWHNLFCHGWEDRESSGR